MLPCRSVSAAVTVHEASEPIATPAMLMAAPGAVPTGSVSAQLVPAGRVMIAPLVQPLAAAHVQLQPLAAQGVPAWGTAVI